ncbi:MAG: excinuclease ABC subunit UvrA [Bacteroidales bacterium]|nr:excinuclease ABC subunit UvrA [Bacteroidales bacterium]
MSSKIKIQNASENNLKNISLEIPKNKLVAVTGVSGSGKSSLVHDVIYREAENRYLGTFSSYARQFLGKMKKPDVEKIEGLSPAIAVNQKTVIRNPRSTVGTITGIYDYLRLLFARLGKPENGTPDFKIDRNLFSFNSPAGACPQCNGLGVEDRIDPELIVADGNKSLREGAFVITAPNGYIIYSQVTMDVLDEVCRAEGFSVDTPWKDLTPENKNVVFFGSNKIEIPFGKHTLESRMKWSGITAKPRDTGFYKGVIPVMAEILKRDRNKNILRFVRSENCSACSGNRLNGNALSVKWGGANIAELSLLSVSELGDFFKECKLRPQEKDVAEPLIHEVLTRVALLEKLGTGYLQINRESTTLSGGESQRLRIATQVTANLKGVLYIFDEPSIGLHPTENQKMIDVLKSLRVNGNTVIVVEHDDEFIKQADHIVDVGPGAGKNGGEVLINTPKNELTDLKVENSKTLDFLMGKERFLLSKPKINTNGWISVMGAAEHNLKNIDVNFLVGALNVVTGASGAGKSTLTETVLARFLKMKLHQTNELPGKCVGISGWEKIKKVVVIDQSPIGRTPRSNPATYTNLSDHLRDLFAALPTSKEKGWKKGRFSFNVIGGRCESCQGAGFQQVGMHFLGDVEIVCDECNGKRFNEETLEIKFQQKNISEILDLSISEAVVFFNDQSKILRIVKTLHDLGLGYLKLGQRSTTLSGGEAQRVKLAAELSKPASAHTLYILDEPTVGLHNADVKVLLHSLKGLVENGNTVIVIEHHQGLIAAADHVLDLGPGSGPEGGNLVFEGTPSALLHFDKSLTGNALKAYFENDNFKVSNKNGDSIPQFENIIFKGISTHNLKNIDVVIPKNKLTVITGVSGSGKSSLAFDTLYAEGRNRFLESFSPYVRTQIGMQAKADFEEVYGITPVIAINRQGTKGGSRSTVGTMTGIYDLYRLLFSRIGISESGKKNPLSSLFSFNHQHGACKACDGLGTKTLCDPNLLISNPEKSLADGAMNGHKWGKFYGDPFGQYIHTLNAAGERLGFDFEKSWMELSEEEKRIALHGTGEEVYEITWKYKRGKREGEHQFKGTWPGFANLINEEYNRKHADHRGETMMMIMKNERCIACDGSRLNHEANQYTILGKNISELSGLSVENSLAFFKDFANKIDDGSLLKISDQLREEILRSLSFMKNLGLGYLSMNRVSHSLSGGEAQRVRLASQLGNGLTDVTFVLDEPTVGLHPADTANLMGIIRQLRDGRNTVVIVEHDREVMLAADNMIELGPAAGEHGGEIIATGSMAEIIENPKSITGKYLMKSFSKIPVSENLQFNASSGKSIVINSASANNLKNMDIEIPIGKLVTISGVSGSGKSSLVFDVIAASALSGKACGCDTVKGLEHFIKVVKVTQEPFSTSQVSNAMTFTGIFDQIREAFAKTPQAQKLKLKKPHFSFNTVGGRCEKCQGQGKIRISLDFISDVWILCDACEGKRYNPQVLSCELVGKSIFDVLEMTITRAINFFEPEPEINEQLRVLEEVGLAYVCLGQSTNTLSGGELQRLKLARELMHPVKGQNLYLFDEPTTGLHFQDVEVLMKLFRKLVDQGHTLIVIEHNSDVILNSDWVIDLGPGGGKNGGEVIFSGRPEALIKVENSLTGKSLVPRI